MLDNLIATATSRLTDNRTLLLCGYFGSLIDGSGDLRELRPSFHWVVPRQIGGQKRSLSKELVHLLKRVRTELHPIAIDANLHQLPEDSGVSGAGVGAGAALVGKSNFDHWPCVSLANCGTNSATNTRVAFFICVNVSFEVCPIT